MKDLKFTIYNMPTDLHLSKQMFEGLVTHSKFKRINREYYYYYYYDYFRTLARSLEPVVTECKEHTIRTQTKTNG